MNEAKPIIKIELLPPLNEKCKIAVTILRIAFTLIPVILGVCVWVLSGWLFGLLIWIIGIFAGLILLSKLKVAYVPFNQHELSHLATTILKWYVAKEFCEYREPNIS